MRNKPCPYCEKENAGAFVTPYQWYIACLECGSRGPIADTPREAWDKWNTRPAQQYNELAYLLDNYNQSTLTHADRVAQLKELIRVCAEQIVSPRLRRRAHE